MCRISLTTNRHHPPVPLKIRSEKVVDVRDPKKTPLRLRLFWPLVALLIISPVAVWKIASRRGTPPQEQTNVHQSKPGPWGELEYIPIAIEIPDHFVDVIHIDETDWIFRNRSQEQVMEFFQSCGLSSEQLGSLRNRAKWSETSEGCHVAPDDFWIENLSAESRAKIYSALAEFPENINQFYAFSYQPNRLEERLEFSNLQESTVALFKKMLYSQGTIVRFADVDVVLRKLNDTQERLRFVKTITRRSSLLVKLKVTPKTDINALLDYWGAGGRAKDLRPLLESLARVPGGCKIDIAHLLPPFARQRIYTYPQPTEQTNVIMEDCHWTALNFFKDRPTEVFASPEEIIGVLESEFMPVPPGNAPQLGDVICLETSEAVVVHSAVYIADDIVFTKNGASLNQPWIYVRMEDMLPYYMMPNQPLELVTYRRK